MERPLAERESFRRAEGAAPGSCGLRSSIPLVFSTRGDLLPSVQQSKRQSSLRLTQRT
jgi:hypothetical protein